MWRKIIIGAVLLCLASYALYEQFKPNEKQVSKGQVKSETTMKDMVAQNGIEVGKAPHF